MFKLELPPQFTGWQWGTNGMQLQLSGVSGHTIEIHASSNLTAWALLATLTNETGQVAYTDLEATNHTRRFYRAYQFP